MSAYCILTEQMHKSALVSYYVGGVKTKNVKLLRVLIYSFY